MAEIRMLEQGYFLDAEAIPDFDVRLEAWGLCHFMAECIAGLVINLDLFESAQLKRVEEKRDRVARHEARALERSLESERGRTLEAESGLPFRDPQNPLGSQKIRLQVRREVLREKWESGDSPESYRFRVPFIHAQSFVSTLALLRNALLAISKYEFQDSVARPIEEAVNGFVEAFPGLKDVRDSVAHADERARGLSRGRKITIQPGSHPMIDAPNGSGLMITSLSGDRYGGTIADGTYAEVQVSDATTELARAAVQAVYDALPWTTVDRQIDPSD